MEAGLASSDHGLVRWSIYVGSERSDDTKESMDYKRTYFERFRRELAVVDWTSLEILRIGYVSGTSCVN